MNCSCCDKPIRQAIKIDGKLYGPKCVSRMRREKVREMHQQQYDNAYQQALTAPLPVTDDLQHIRTRRALAAHRRQFVRQASSTEKIELAGRGIGRLLERLWKK
jgi:hypothetical protein